MVQRVQKKGYRLRVAAGKRVKCDTFVYGVTRPGRHVGTSILAWRLLPDTSRQLATRTTPELRWMC